MLAEDRQQFHLEFYWSSGFHHFGKELLFLFHFMNRSGDLICHFRIWIALIGRTKRWASLFVFPNAMFEGLAVKVELFL